MTPRHGHCYPDCISTTDHGFGQCDRLQSAAEAVHLAIKLLEHGLSECEFKSREYEAPYLRARCDSVIEELKPAMMILNPYMPHPIGDSKPPQRSKTLETLSASSAAEQAVRDDQAALDDENTGYHRDDERDWATRHA